VGFYQNKMHSKVNNQQNEKAAYILRGSFAYHLSDKGTISIIYEEFKDPKSKKLPS
jgi:hypothetical protein